MITFLRPYWLMAFIVFLILIWQLYKKKEHSSQWEEVCDPHLINQLLISFGKTNKLPSVLLAIYLFSLIIALAGPSFKEENVPVYRTGQTTVILLDLSHEMLVEDITPSRLVRAKYKIEDLLKKKPEYRYALVVFSQESFTVTPVTDDAKTIIEMIPVLSPDLMPVTGKDIGGALCHVKALIKQSGSSSGDILLFTTGQSNANAENEAAKLKQDNITLSIIGVGTSQGAPIPAPFGFVKDQEEHIVMSKLDVNSLEKLAKIGGGTFHVLTHDNSDLNEITKTWNRVDQQKKKQFIINTKRDDGYWLLFIIVGIVLLAFRPGWFHAIVR